ncbi:MAG: OmpA family protein [Candidatus Acidiferrales bacterium]
MCKRLLLLLTVVPALILLSAGAVFAQEGKIKIKVTPKQGYIFLDGNAIREGGQTLKVSPGQHTVVITNYGYKMFTQTVTVEAGKTADLDVKLEPAGGDVSGPWGDIELKGDSRAAVLLNGKTPDYFVGHLDEFNFNWWVWHQELLVPPGTHHLTVSRGGKELWSGDVTVAANQKVTIYIDKNQQKTGDFKNRGEKLAAKPLPRFKVGIASATIAVAKVSGSFSSSVSQINCGDTAKLNWTTAETVHSEISGVGEVPASGERDVSPHQTTTYDFTSSGPGGVVKGTSTVNVNTTVQASLNVAPQELHYRKIGDKVVDQGTATVTWSTSNANDVSVDPFGNVDKSGSKTVDGTPKQTTEGPVDETTNFTLKASNVCGGSATQSAALHITGSIEPIPNVPLASVFYPTDYPDVKHPNDGLLKSQQDEISAMAAGFKKYLEYDPTAKISVLGYADKRGSVKYNMSLAERRNARIEQFLISQGVSADHITTTAYGKEKPLDPGTIKQLETENPNKASKKMARAKLATELAYNRRVDFVLIPSNKESLRYYPNNAAEAGVLWQMPKPSLKIIEKYQ